MKFNFSKIIVLASAGLLLIFSFSIYENYIINQKVQDQLLADSLNKAVVTTFNNAQSKKVELERQKHYRENWYDLIKESNNKYTYNELGGIYNLEISIKNSIPYSIDELNVIVVFLKRNGDVYKRENLVFKNISPNSISTLKVPDSDRGTSIEYGITEIKAKSFNFCYSEGTWAARLEDPYRCVE